MEKKEKEIILFLFKKSVNLKCSELRPGSGFGLGWTIFSSADEWILSTVFNPHYECIIIHHQCLKKSVCLNNCIINIVGEYWQICQLIWIKIKISTNSSNFWLRNFSVGCWERGWWYSWWGYRLIISQIFLLNLEYFYQQWVNHFFILE